MNEHPNRARRRLVSPGAIAATAAAATLVITGCGGGTSATGGSATYRKAVAYAQCMRSHGEPGFPDPSSTGTFSLGQVNINSTEYQTATQARANLLPNSVQFQLSGAQRQKFLQMALKNAECMRAHGITDFPDPNPNNLSAGPGGVRMSLAGSGVSASTLHSELMSPIGQAAFKACAPPGTHVIGPGKASSGGRS